MDKIAWIIGETYIYWQSIILMIASVTAILMFAGLYIGKSGNVAGTAAAVPMAMISGLFLARLVHWYCQSAAYESFTAAITDWSGGSFALMGVFAGCLLTACLLRLVRLVRNLPQMLDCMVLAGSAGIAVGRLASLYSAADRGMILQRVTPLAFPVVNAITGQMEYRLATFLLQAMATGIIFLVLLSVWLVGRKGKQLPDGEITLRFLMLYGAAQALLDSTRYDSLFLRSNGFVSVVQILSLLAMVTVIVIFSVKMVKAKGWQWEFLGIWLGELVFLGGAGYMEYYVQRHGDRALKAYSMMAICLMGTVLLTALIRRLGLQNEKSGGKYAAAHHGR
ncbi:MAG: prolipoprotein diacylglyceryl transferase [Oscillospiraceae bacterium]|nr:prolipoprotein diacylglyceryl transferase [Oscillospiraceae bacterium]